MRYAQHWVYGFPHLKNTGTIAFSTDILPACLPAGMGKQLGQIFEALPQVLGKVLNHKRKCFNKVNASSTK